MTAGHPTSSESADAPWFEREEAARLMRLELAQFRPRIVLAHGANGLCLMAGAAAPPVLSGNMVRHLLLARLDDQEPPTLTGDVVFSPTNWPLATGSCQVVYLIHALERSSAPEVLLAEASRILDDSGRLMILCFRRFSPLKLRHGWRGLPGLGGNSIRRSLSIHGFDWLDEIALGVTTRRPPSAAELDQNRQQWRLPRPRILSSSIGIIARKRRTNPSQLISAAPKPVPLQAGLAAA